MTDENKPTSMMDFMDRQGAEDDQADINVIVGGELITYTAQRVGEKSSKQAKERGWLSAMSTANGKNIPTTERLRNVQTIATEAIKRGVLTEQQVNAQLAEMKIQFASASEPASAPEAVTQEKAKTALPTIDYDNVAKALPLNESLPSKPDQFIQPAVTNMFHENDTATLGGRVIASLYDKLVKRQDAKEYTEGEVVKLMEVSKATQEDYVKTVGEVNKKRKQNGLPELELAATRTSGQDGFHFNGNTRPSKDFLFYFDKSKTHYKSKQDVEVRAYITIKPQEKEKIQQHFVELCMELYDAGIDFSAKAASVFGVSQRADNMVLYINAPDQPKAADIIKKFLKQKSIGEGHILAGIPSDQEGLSWAMEPTKAQTELWKKISGATTEASYNVFVASLAAPAYLDRLAAAHRKKGDIASAQEFEKEAVRIRALIKAA